MATTPPKVYTPVNAPALLDDLRARVAELEDRVRRLQSKVTPLDPVAPEAPEPLSAPAPANETPTDNAPPEAP